MRLTGSTWRTASGRQLTRRQVLIPTGLVNQEALMQEGRTGGWFEGKGQHQWKRAAPRGRATGLEWHVALYLLCQVCCLGELSLRSVLSHAWYRTRSFYTTELPGTKIKGVLGEVSEGRQGEGTGFLLDSGRKFKKESF